MTHTTPTPLAVLDHAAVGRPITRAGVSLVPVHLHQALPGPVLTGPSAPVDIREADTESVPVLTVTSDAADPVLLVEGETVVGGLQHRSLDVSVLVPPRATVEVPVSCVEAGRWGGGRSFRRGASRSSTRVRRASSLGVVAPAVQGRRRSAQSAVWAAVDEQLEALDLASPTRNLADADAVLAHDRRRSEAVAELVELGPLPGQCGVVVLHGRHVVGAEVLGSPDLLRDQWEPLVRSLVLDAPTGVDGRPSVGRALRFLARLAAARWDVGDGVGMGREGRTRSARLVGQLLAWDAAVVHASAFALAA